MSSGFQPPKPDAGAGGKKRKRKNVADDFVSVDSMSPTKRILRSATATPVKTAVNIEEVPNKGNKPRDSKGRTTLKLSPRKSISNNRNLPFRLMEPKEIPTTGKITSYSKPEYLVNIAKILRGTKFFDALIKSPLGSLFKIPACKIALSGKLVRNMLCRMLPTRKRHEIWFLLANRPIRMSLKEFAKATGLPCGQYPTDSFYAECNSIKDSNNAYWNKLMVGSLRKGLLKDIENLLWKDAELKEERDKLSMTQKMRLCLVLLVDGVLCPKTSTKMASRFTVEMVKNVGMFMKYPWGRDSFELTLEMVRVNSQSTKSLEDMVRKLKKKTHVLVKGLTIAFQLVIFQAVPAFNAIMFSDNFDDDRDVANVDIRELEQSRYFDNKRILQIDNDPNTEVISYLDEGFGVDGVDFSYKDEVTDPTVDCMISKIKNGSHFTKMDWCKGIYAEGSKAGPSITRKTRASKPTTVYTPRKHPGRNIPSKSAIPAEEFDFVYDPEDQIQAFFYPTLRKQTDEKNKRDFADNELTLLKTLKELCGRTKADTRCIIDDGNVQSLSTKGSSGNSDSESINQRRKVDAKGKGKAHLSDVESEEDDEVTESDHDEFLREMTGNTTNIPASQPTRPTGHQDIPSDAKDSFEKLCDQKKNAESDNDEFLREMAGNTADIPVSQTRQVNDDEDSFEAACDARKEVAGPVVHSIRPVDLGEESLSDHEGKRADITGPYQEAHEVMS